MKITRREFGLTLLMGLGAMLLLRIFGRFRGIKPEKPYASARHWSRGGRLAG